jgi:Tfp pilus assembly protein PilN
VVKTRLNLASKPFRNRALPWTITLIITLFSIFALIFVLRATFQENAQAQSVERDVKGLQSDADTIKRRAEEVKSILTPEQQRTLKAAHALVDRKRFSWTRLFADLEAAMPGGVRVVRIAVKDVGRQGDREIAILDLTVASKSPAIVTDMISAWEREGIFNGELVSQNLQRGRGETGAEYEMNVRYTPRPGSPIEPSEQTTRPVDTAPNGANRTAP